MVKTERKLTPEDIDHIRLQAAFQTSNSLRHGTIALIHDLELEWAENERLREALVVTKTKAIDCLNKGGPYTHVLLDIHDEAQDALKQ